MTCREVGDPGDDFLHQAWGPLRKELLTLGITGGATHVDIEVRDHVACLGAVRAAGKMNLGCFLWAGRRWRRRRSGKMK